MAIFLRKGPIQKPFGKTKALEDLNLKEFLQSSLT